MHGIRSIYRHIGRTGLGWIDGQKSAVFRRGKSGNPTLKPLQPADVPFGGYKTKAKDLGGIYFAAKSIFTTRCYASAVLANSHGFVSVCVCICLSVCRKSELY